METTWKAGLEDVIAARSAIAAIDGAKGRLYYRGYEIGDLAAHASFEETAYLLWFGELPSPAEREAFRRRLRAARPVPQPVLALAPHAARGTPSARRAPHRGLARGRGRSRRSMPATTRRTCARPSASWRSSRRWSPPGSGIRTGREPVAARPGGSHAAHFLRLLDGRAPAPEVAQVLDVILTLHADHELNASTFAARVAVATLADFHAAIAAAIATLKGPRHGGANEDVLAMLLEIGDPARAEAFVEARLGARRARLPAGAGGPADAHPGLRPPRLQRGRRAGARAPRMAKSMAEATGRAAALRGRRARLRQPMTARTSLPVNVDFFSAVVYDALGIPPDFCTSIFAVGRVAGWCAHALEQYADNRLIRPRADYVGVAPREIPAGAR